MQLKKVLVKKIIHPLIEIKKGTSTMTYLDFYNKSQWWGRQKLRDLQAKKVRQLINYAYSNVPYYRKVFKNNDIVPGDVRDEEDLSKIPILTHETIRRNLRDLISIGKSQGSLLRFQTAGTTGHPLISYKDRNEISSGLAALYRGWKWCGYHIGEKRAIVWGVPTTFSWRDAMKGKMERFLTRSVLVPAWSLDERKIKYFINILNAKKPRFLAGYASIIYLFADFINHNRLNLKFDPVGVSTTAEPIVGFQRNAIEEAFGCEVFDQYGCAEVFSIGFECEEHLGLHISSERVYVEFLDLKDNSPVSEGEIGRIVVTSLENYGMPIIRYDTEDLGIRSEESCTCGRHLPLINSIVGRKNDMIKLPNGSVLHGLFFTYTLQDVDWIMKYGINQFQVVQKKENSILLKIRSKHEPDQKDLESYKQLVEKYLGNVIFEIEFVDDIPVSPSGKRRYVISEV